MALCKETANLNRGYSSAILTIILGIPEVETVIRFGDIPIPSGLVILAMAFITLG